MPKVPVNGLNVYYEVRGEGDPLLLVAGFGCDHTIWAKVASALASRYRVIAFDNRGTGQTAGPVAAAGIRQMADDAAGLLDALGTGPAHVAGHSMGGLIAQELALAHPERVRSLLLLSTCARLDERGKAITASWGELPRQVDAATATRLILPWMYTSAFYAKPGAVDEVIAQVVANPFPPSAEAIDAQSRAIIASDNLDRLGAIGCPTRVLVGEGDILLPVAFSEEVARGIRGAELVVLRQTGHGLLIESPRAVAAAMMDFLARQGNAHP
jgi:pimeloyl-ACP methyl ester carboxylesterase